jgi:DNA sulfur modification protein DndD
MILKKVKIKNFKQFHGENEIVFNTNGKVTILYGFNGFGKTRLHSFFNWLFYGEDRDNEIIYNKPNMDQSFSGDTSEVIGEIEFEHNSIDYILRRSEEFKKNTSKINSLGSVLRLRYLDDNKNWRTIVNPKNEIKKILPQELSQYFFFDGEGMLNELLGKTSSRKFGTNLKDAINTIFGLRIYENAIKDLGSGKTSVTYELSKQLKDTNGKNKASGLIKYISHTSKEIEDLETAIETNDRRIEDLNTRNDELSKLIGKAADKDKLETQRKNNLKLIDKLNKEIEDSVKRVGRYTTEKVSYLMVSKNITNSKQILSKKAEENYVSGLTRPLVENLITNAKCICGNEITDDEVKQLTKLLDFLPPKSYKSVYLDYKRNAQKRLESADLSLEIYTNILAMITTKRGEIIDLREQIENIDKELNSIKHIAPYVNERKENESEIKRLNKKVKDDIDAKAGKSLKLEGAKQQLKAATNNSKHNKLIQNKIEFVESIKDMLEDEYSQKRLEYRSILQNNIIELADKMLSVERNIELLDNYTLSVKDNFNNHILSEGQAAIMTFSYIGGILNSLKQLSVEYVSTEYPLILDAPLSKLDPYHIAKVLEHLPTFSNQIIIFSKEEIDQLITKDDKEYIYQIMANKEANKARLCKYVGHDYFKNIAFRVVE